MDQHPTSFGAIVRQPSAFLPLAMSIVALALVIGHVVPGVIQNGHVLRAADEGAEAHIWQLLMVAQIPVLACFAIRWLPRAPEQAMKVLALQASAALANLAVIFLMRRG